MGCCCSRFSTFKEYPEDGTDLNKLYTDTPWVHRTDPTQLADIRITKNSGNNIAGDEPLTVYDCFKRAAERHPNAPALRHEAQHADKKKFETEADRDSPPRSEWKTWTYSQYFAESKAVAKSILASGLQNCDGVGVWGFNSPYWIMAASAAMLSGGVNMGVYPTDTTDIVAYKIKHCNCQVVFVEGEKQQRAIEKLYTNGDLNMNDDGTCKLKAIVCWSTPGSQDTDLLVYTWEAFKEFGSKVSDEQLSEVMTKQAPGKVVNYCYTSGTTGLPKAVMLTNDNLTWNAKSTLLSATPDIEYPEEIRSLSYLPLSHVAATMLDLIAPLVFTAGLMTNPLHNKSYWTLYFARPYDLKLGTIKERIFGVKPVVFLAVPRVWEKLEDAMKAKAQTGTVGAIIASLKAKNVRNAEARQLGGTGASECCTCLANAIGNKVKKVVGLDESLFNITGAAPIRAETLRYFASIGLDIFELYGMSEMCATATANKPGASYWGTIGGKMDGMEVACFDKKTNEPVTTYFNYGAAVPDAAQGELRSRGRNIMMGYMANPRLGQEHVDMIMEKNKNTIDKGGWIWSGDKAARTVDGMFKITGRYKELIITAGGENVAPIPIEDNVKVLCPLISNIMMHGDKMPYNIALITVRMEGANGEVAGTNKLDPFVWKGIPEEQRDCKTIEELMQKDESHPIIRQIIEAIELTNKNKICVPSNPCKIQKFTLLPRDFSVEYEELTPTLKLKRSVVSKQYDNAISKVYAASREAKYVNTSAASQV